jgi:hypothetical protein
MPRNDDIWELSATRQVADRKRTSESRPPGATWELRVVQSRWGAGAVLRYHQRPRPPETLLNLCRLLALNRCGIQMCSTRPDG